MTRLPLHSSTAHNSDAGTEAPPPITVGKKTIEETYQKKTQLEHILLRPDTYIGSVERHTQSLWVFENDEMVYRPVTYVPGLYKIFDEILVNAADNKQRDPSMDAVKVEIDVESNRISIYNNGDGVPVEIHQEEKVYVPELIFGHLLTSSNYDDNVKKTTGGRNGYGAKLTNIFSTDFIIETADGKRQKKYKQVFSDNMGKKTEPTITKCREGENWTKVTFKPDLAKFNMEHLEDDVVALMKKRVVDIAGTLGKTVKVELNGKRIPVKSFVEYCNLYLQSAAKDKPEPLPKICEKVSDRWEICVSLSDGQFQQVSFVNGINTVKGGTHVEYVTGQITNHLLSIVKKKNKNAKMTPATVKNYLWVFVNALIDNPAFDSQTKETLTTRQVSFGSKCELSQDFLKKVAKSGVVDSLLSWADFKQSKELKKTDGAKKQRITGIPKLEDANDAGGSNSDRCTLILTEGDSAKALAMAGISVVGRNHYGVFPLRGKLLNVREASHKQIKENAEINHIKQALGLQHGKVYDSVKGLRYGHLMIMTDQDHDGSHIKGLLINFIHSFWPSLLRIPTFMLEFITPIVKATNRSGKVLSFYTMPEYEAWKESLGGKSTGWSVKYYKGLGTSTSKEGKDYFSDLGKHKKDFLWEDDQDGDAIELAFSKKKIEARKNWLRQFEPGTYLDQREKRIKYSDFINKELILFSLADLQRSIPSMVDGLKPGQRKILFCSFKRKFTKEAKVAQFSGYVSEHSAYHHGEQSLASTIIGMAQDFVGSNNINLLQPNGQFGTRHQGGKDHASSRYIYTRLSHVTRFLFPKDDDMLLQYLNEDGQSIEPTWYMPIIPVVLVNGSEGIGTGWSSYVPNYNPREIIANVRRLLNNEPMQPMDPWYRGFKGRIEKSATKTNGVTYTITGIIEETDDTTVRITELPIRRWTQDYKEFLESLMTGTDKIKEPFIKDYREYNDDQTVDFEVMLTEENMNIARQEGLEKKFKLTNTISTSNMHLFDSNGIIKKYETPEQILEEFYHLRLEFYSKRKNVLLDTLELELLKLDNKVRFILGVVNNEIIVSKRKRRDLVVELKERGFTPFPKNAKIVEAAGDEAAEEGEGNEGGNEDMEIVDGVRITDYEYLLSMSIGTLTLERVKQLCDEKNKVQDEVEELRGCSPKDLWKKDLDALEVELNNLDKEDSEAEEARKKLQKAGINNRVGTSKPAARKPRKANSAKASTEATSKENDTANVAATKKPKAQGRQKKVNAGKKTVDTESDEDSEMEDLQTRLAKKNISTTKKSASMESDEESEELDELETRLAAYNLESSPDHAEMETGPLSKGGQKKKEATKRTTARKTNTFISDEEEDTVQDHMPTIMEDSDDEFDVEEVAKPKRGGGRGTKASAARKRGSAAAKSKTIISQKLITDILKPAENTGVSPEKKVRKMRGSPFNKKSGSVLGRTTSAASDKSEDSANSMLDSSAEGFVAPTAAANRPRREKKVVTKYVISESEEDDDAEAASEDYSDFEEEDDE